MPMPWSTTDNSTSLPSIDRKSTRLNSSHLGISYAVFCLLRPLSMSRLVPYTTLFRSLDTAAVISGNVLHDRESEPGATGRSRARLVGAVEPLEDPVEILRFDADAMVDHRQQHLVALDRSEEHTSELQSLRHLVCRLLLVAASIYVSPRSLHDALPISRHGRRD